jgi:hypothetical protein
MDIKVSHKETRVQPGGPVEILADNVFDLYPVFAADDDNLITDIEILDDPEKERLDRAMFALAKQRGQDPVEPDDGVQWAEALLGEVPPSTIIQQAHRAVSREGPGVRVVPGILRNGNTGSLYFKIDLT